MAWMTIAPRIDPKARISRSPARAQAATAPRRSAMRIRTRRMNRASAASGREAVHRRGNAEAAEALREERDQRLDPRRAQRAGRGQQVERDRRRRPVGEDHLQRAAREIVADDEIGQHARCRARRAARAASRRRCSVAAGPLGRTAASSPPGPVKRHGRRRRWYSRGRHVRRAARDGSAGRARSR